MNSVWFAGFFPDPEVIAAFLVPMGLFGVPMMAILTRHQRQMAEIIHGRRHEDILRADVEGLRAEVSELRTQLRALGQGSSTAGAIEELRNRQG